MRRLHENVETRTKGMNELFLQFPQLWEMFCCELKNSYIEHREKFYQTKESEPPNWSEALYHDAGFRFWYSKEGKCQQMLRDFEERFYEYGSGMYRKLANYDMLEVEIKRNSFSEEKPDSSAKPLHFIDMLRRKTSRRYRKRIWSADFEKTWTPALQKRKDEIVQYLSEIEESSKLPVQYELELESEHSIVLQFEDTRRINHPGWNGLEGYQYTLNGRTYTDVSSLYEKTVENITKNLYICEDTYGSRVLCQYLSIPTFDTADREWDSKSILHLMFDGKDIHLIVMRGGYKIANLTFYNKLLSADKEIKPYLEKLMFPVEDIVWIESDGQEAGC